MTNADPSIPLHVVTGFLGSGKTTLLQRLLKLPALADTAVIINEFGAIGLDHRLVRHVSERAIMIEGGCACCNLRDDLRETVVRLLTRRKVGDVPPFKRIILETSGLADPAPILFTLESDYVLREYLRRGRVITTVDGVNGMAQLTDQPEAFKQVAVADTLVVTKGDIAEPALMGKLRDRLASLNPMALHLDALNDDIGADLLTDAKRPLGAGRWQPLGKIVEGAEHTASGLHHGRAICSFTLTYDAPIDWTAFSIWLTMLLSGRGGEVLRVKGILNVNGSPAPLVIQGVQHIMHRPVHLDDWPDADRRSYIVFIVQDIEPSALKASLDCFLDLGQDLRRAYLDSNIAVHQQFPTINGLQLA